MKMQMLCRIGLMVFVALVFTTSASAYTIKAGVTLDVHQDIGPTGLPWPNDFHVEGLICTKTGILPVLIDHLDDIFPYFTSNLQPLGDCWFRFTADWSFPPGSPGIPYCTVIHLGLLFDVQDENTVIDLIGWWTLNGQRIGDIIGGQLNGGYIPLTGFLISDITIPPGQSIRIGNGFVPPAPLPPPSPWPIPIEIVQMDLIPFHGGEQPQSYFRDLYAGGPQELWPWIPVNNNGSPISPINPLPVQIDSFFDVFFQISQPGAPGVAAGSEFMIPPDGFLFSRTKISFMNNSGMPEERWVWHIHQAQGPEACCFPSGQCADLTPNDCVAEGGFPMGMGTTCQTTTCPQSVGACCYGDQTGIQCVVTDEVYCQQTLGGIWHGEGTDCADLNGNGVADVCEEASEACCMSDGLCQDLPPTQCKALGGTAMGAGTECATTICEVFADLGDAPDSTNHFGVPMTAYPSNVIANFPTVYWSGVLPYGPIHNQAAAVAFLGAAVSTEAEADIGTDTDGVNNIIPLNDLPDRDGFDDGVFVPMILPHCVPTTFTYTVTIAAPILNQPLYVNAWFDWDRNGDWDGVMVCGQNQAPEWAVQNQVLPAGLPAGTYQFQTPAFLPWHPPTGEEPSPIWMRITLAEQPWQPTGTSLPGYGGSGPAYGYQYGETEDYYFTPIVDVTPPEVIGAVSRKIHNLAGTFDIDLLNPIPPATVAVECRRGGPTLAIITFNEAIYGSGPGGSAVPSDVKVVDTAGSVITVSSVSIAGLNLTINMTGVANATRATIRFPGIMDAAGNISTSSVCFGVLVGDANGNGGTNVQDLLAIKNQVNKPVTAANFRMDVTADGGINVQDLLLTKNNLNKVVPPLPCP